MKKKLLFFGALPKFLIHGFSYSDHYSQNDHYVKVKLSLLFSFFCFSLWAQHSPFTTNGSIVIPAGITTIEAEAWGGGGAGGGASNSAALTGRGGAGGGGGAYAHGNIPVVAGTTINVKVAQPIIATAGSGGNGESSYIESFESIFLAVGGNGGIANTTGTSTGGTGGLDTASKGSLAVAPGLSGGQGNFFLLNLGGSSGAGGKAGGAAGGAGGASRTSALLGIGPGIQGTPPGGGGSGGLHLAGSAAQIGGDGGRGEVRVTYTCPTYGISGISALNACTSLGTSLVTFTSSAGLMPIGVYTVTYNTSLPAATALTATMTVDVAGTGKFTAVGLTTPGNSNITVTNLKSGVCNTDILASNVATITVSGPSVGGSVTGGTAICSGQLSPLLTVSGYTGSVVKWQSSTDSFNTITDIANTAATYTSGPLTQNTQFRAVIQSGVCSSANSTATTVTVNPLPQGSLTANGPFCATGAGQLVFTATAGTGPYTVVYKENGGADRIATNVISATPFNTFTAPVTTSTTYTLVSVTGANNCMRSSGFTTGSAVITVNPLPSVPIIGTVTQPTCTTPTGSIVLSGLLGSPNWTITQNGTTTYTSTGTNYTIPNLAPGNYTFTIHDISSCQSLPTLNVEINAVATNTWNGTSWSKGSLPVITDIIRFSGDYITTADLSGCSCVIDSGVNITVSPNNTLTISDSVINNGGQLIFENNSSLVQTNSNSNINSGNITYKRTTKQILRGDFIYWSTPVNLQKLIDVSPGTLYNKYLDFNGDYWGEVDRNSNMMVGKGYIIRGPQNYSITERADYTASFTGVPNNGNISGQTLQAGKYYLIGNPYPSALDADMLISANSFLNGTIFFWTHNTPVSLQGAYQYTTDDYASYNTTGGVAISAKSDPGHTDNPATDAGVKPTGKVAAGQSFFAEALSNGTVSFTNDMRLGGANNNQFFKTANTSKKTDDIERHRVWLNMANTQGAFKQLLVGYIEGATNAHDNMFDGETQDANPYLDFYSMIDDRKYVIQGRELPFSDTDLVPLGYRSKLISDFTISIDQVDGNLINQDIYIQDKVTGVTHNLKTGGYKFSTVIGTFDDRFILRYTNNTLGTDDFENTDKEVLISVKNKIITINAIHDLIDQILVYDITGKEIYKKSNLNDAIFQIENLKSQNQVLLVKVRLGNNNITTQKIVF